MPRPPVEVADVIRTAGESFFASRFEPAVACVSLTFWAMPVSARVVGDDLVAISNHRLITLADGMVTFRWRDSAHHNKKRLMMLPVNEFLRRFLLHVLPPGFVRIRYFGWMAHRR